MPAMKPRAEFHEYARGLQKIKRDVNKIVQFSRSQTSPEERLEDVIPCLKRILERIVYGCLEIQIPVYGKRTSIRRWRNKKASQLVKEVEPQFYPSPNPDRGGPYIKVSKSVSNSDVLTQQQWLTAWDFVNRIQHVQNPASTKQKPDPQKALDDVLKWTQRAINLLSHHSIITTDTAFFGEAVMHPPNPNSNPQVRVLERMESWETTHRLPDGSTLTLQQRNDNGEWKDVQDPEQGAIATGRLHGIYTHRGFFPVHGAGRSKEQGPRSSK